MSSEEKLFDELRSLIITGNQGNIKSDEVDLLEKINKLEKDFSDAKKFNRKLKENKDTLIDLLGPTMGKLIKRFIASEMAKINQSLGDKKRRLFAIGRPKKRLRDETNILVQRNLVQIFLIQKKSGLLMGEYSRQETLDSDIISGMMTAIKAFVENAFGKEGSELESLDYSEFSIQLFELGSFYFAFVLETKPNEKEKSLIFSDLLIFIENHQNDLDIENNSKEVKKLLSSWAKSVYNFND